MSCLHTMTCELQPSTTCHFHVFRKISLNESCLAFEDLLATKFHCPTLSGAIFASTLEV
jgi:hypothetical protein